MIYFIVHVEHQIILGTADIPYSSFTSQFVECTKAQVTRYEELQSVLPPDVYVELSDIIRPALTDQAEQTRATPATPATRAAIKSLFRS